MLPIFESSNDSEHFFIVDLIVAFCVSPRLGAVSDRVPEIVVESLKEDTTCCIAESVYFKACGSIWVPHG